MLHLNLFYEQQQIQRDKDLDPVRFALIGGTLLVLGIGLWGSMLWVNMNPVRENLDKKTKEHAAVLLAVSNLGTRTDLDGITRQSMSMQNRVGNRVLFSPQLDVYRDLIPTNCQVMTFSATHGMRKISQPEKRKVKDPETKNMVEKTVLVEKQVPTVDTTLVITMKAKKKVEVLQLQDEVENLIRRDPRIRQWAATKPDADGSTNVWNEVTRVAHTETDPTRSTEMSVGTVTLKIPMAVKDTPQEVAP